MPNTRLRAIRHAMRLTQEEFAERLGCSWRTVHRWETGETTRPPVALVRSLEAVTGQPVERLGFDVLPGADFWADHDAGVVREPGREPLPGGALAGVWESHCVYRSGSRGGAEFHDRCHLVVVQSGATLSAQSIPGSSPDGTSMRLEVQGRVVTGSWEVTTAADSYYRGLVFHGALQLKLDHVGAAMTGLWVGIGSEDDINHGPWTLLRRDSDASRAGEWAWEPGA